MLTTHLMGYQEERRRHLVPGHFHAFSPCFLAPTDWAACLAIHCLHTMWNSARPEVTSLSCFSLAFCPTQRGHFIQSSFPDLGWYRRCHLELVIMHQAVYMAVGPVKENFQGFCIRHCEGRWYQGISRGWVFCLHWQYSNVIMISYTGRNFLSIPIFFIFF